MESKKRPLGFVNRRGHDADVSAADLASLSIDAQPEETSEPVVVKGSKKSPKSASKPPKTRRHARWSRKKTCIVVAIVVLLIAIPVLAGEILRAQYLASTAAAKDSLKTIVSKDVLPLQKKADITAKQTSAVTDKLENVRDSMCPGGLLDNMASVYPRAKSAHGECIDQRGRIASLVTQLRDMEKMLSYIESLNTALAVVNTPTTDAYAVIATQQSNWQSVSEALGKLNPPTTLKSGHDQLATAVKSISDGWSKLNIASNAQNTADFQAAEKQLNDGYVAVRASKAVFAEVITDKQATISKLSAHLY